MGPEKLYLLVTLILLICAIVRERRDRRRHWAKSTPASPELPPGPRPWPLVGNIFEFVGMPPHVSLSQLAEKYGPVMTLRLGAMTTVVLSSPHAAREMFKLHDVALGGRMVYESMKLSSGSQGSVITAQIGPHWRMLRRLYASQFFTASRLDATEDVRRRCMRSMVRAVGLAGRNGACPVDMGRMFFLMAYDHIGRVALSQELLRSNSKEGHQFFHHAKKIMSLAGRLNVADLVPALRRWDPQGIRRKMDFHVGEALGIVAGFVTERRTRRRREGGGTKKDFLDVLLEFHGDGVEEPSQLTPQTINNIILELFMGGTDTTANTLEWAMAELLRHPRVMKKLQAELSQRRHPGDRDTANLPYLNAVVKETLRLHPPLPFLVPRMASKSTTMLGHSIPQGTQILVNVWKMGRDGKYWNDPLEFTPERFLEEANAVDFKGQHFGFTPFGSGRRICPALPLMSRMLPFVLEMLLRSFDWALPSGLTPEAMDMGERMGISLHKAVPLHAIAVPNTPVEAHEMA